MNHTSFVRSLRLLMRWAFLVSLSSSSMWQFLLNQTFSLSVATWYCCLTHYTANNRAGLSPSSETLAKCTWQDHLPWCFNSSQWFQHIIFRFPGVRSSSIISKLGSTRSLSRLAIATLPPLSIQMIRDNLLYPRNSILSWASQDLWTVSWSIFCQHLQNRNHTVLCPSLAIAAVLLPCTYYPFGKHKRPCRGLRCQAALNKTY